MDYLSLTFVLALLQILWIDLLLSGDNAVVIAMACRSLPPHQRKLGMMLGAGTAVLLRILLAKLVINLLGIPYLKLAGGLLLFWIAVKLLLVEHEEPGEIHASDNLWRAVRTVALADLVMSLDNVVAISAAARGQFSLFVLGVVLSIPLIVVGSALITTLIQRLPVFVWAGAALLGWIAGEMLISDPMIIEWLAQNFAGLVTKAPHAFTGHSLSASAGLHYAVAVAGAVAVVITGFILSRSEERPSR